MKVAVGNSDFRLTKPDCRRETGIGRDSSHSRRPCLLGSKHRAVTESKQGCRGIEMKGHHAPPVRPADCVIVTNIWRGAGMLSSLEGIVLLLILVGVALSADWRLPPQPCGSDSHHFRVSVNKPLTTFQRMASLIVNVTVPAPGWHHSSRTGAARSGASNSMVHMNAKPWNLIRKWASREKFPQSQRNSPLNRKSRPTFDCRWNAEIRAFPQKTMCLSNPSTSELDIA